MQTLVEHQGKTLDQIEDHMDNTVDDIEKGVKHTDEAIKTAKRTRTVSIMLNFQVDDNNIYIFENDKYVITTLIVYMCNM